MQWKLAEAENKFGELINLVFSEGPQEVERRGGQVIVISKAEYEKLSREKPSLIEYLLDESGPSLEELDLERDRSEMRDVIL